MLWTNRKEQETEEETKIVTLFKNEFLQIYSTFLSNDSVIFRSFILITILTNNIQEMKLMLDHFPFSLTFYPYTVCKIRFQSELWNCAAIATIHVIFSVCENYIAPCCVTRHYNYGKLY